MAKRVRSNGFLYASPFCGVATGMPDSLRCNVIAFLSVNMFAGEKVDLRFAPPPVLTQCLEKSRAERYISIFAALTLADVNYHPLTVYVANPESDQFRPAHTRRVKRHQHGSMKKIAGAVNETPDFIEAEDDRQSSPSFSSIDRSNPFAFQANSFERGGL